MHEAPCILKAPPARAPAATVTSAASVLLVDDQRTNRLVCRGCLENEGYRVREAVDGRAALEAVAEERPDAILMDVMMPVMDGLACTRLLKSEAQTRDIPVIMVSARTDAHDIVAGLEAGADEYLTKPIRSLELMARVRTMVRLSQERRDLLRSYALRDEQVRVLSAMLEFCRRVGAHQTLDDILDHTLTAVAAVMLSRRVSLMLPNEDRPCLTVARQIGLDQAVARRRIDVPVGSATAGRVFSSGRAVVAKAPNVTFLKMAAENILGHHERYDGSGYPRGFQGRSIPLSARIVALADVYDPLTTDRVYERAGSHEEARNTIRSRCGTHFDPAVVEAFLRCADSFRRLAVEMGDTQSPLTHDA